MSIKIKDSVLHDVRFRTDLLSKPILLGMGNIDIFRRAICVMGDLYYSEKTPWPMMYFWQVMEV